MGGSAITFLRDADWLDGGRVKAYAVILGLASLVLAVISWFDAMGPAGTDFLAFWGAAKATLAGDPAAAYNLAVQEQIQTATGSQGWFAYVNPPPFLFAVAPFGLLPFPAAWVAWVAITYAFWAWTAIRAFPKLWLPILVFPGALIAAGHAQNGFVTGALLVGGVALLDRRPILAGMFIGALVVKPHLAVLVPFWLAAGGRWKAFVSAGCTALGLLGLSWLVFGTGTMLAYAGSWDASAAIMRGDDAGFYLRMATLYGQVRVHAGAGLALALNALLAAGMLILVLRSWRRFGGDALATGAFMLAATALASPYLFNYDLPFLVLPIMWLAMQGLERGFRPWEKALLVLLYLAPYATRAAALPLHLNLMPVASAVLAWLVWTRARTS